MKFDDRELNLLEMSVREWLINVKKDINLDESLKEQYVRDLKRLKNKITYIPKWWEFWK